MYKSSMWILLLDVNWCNVSPRIIHRVGARHAHSILHHLSFVLVCVYMFYVLCDHITFYQWFSSFIICICLHVKCVVQKHFHVTCHLNDSRLIKDITWDVVRQHNNVTHGLVYQPFHVQAWIREYHILGNFYITKNFGSTHAIWKLIMQILI